MMIKTVLCQAKNWLLYLLLGQGSGLSGSVVAGCRLWVAGHGVQPAQGLWRGAEAGESLRLRTSAGRIEERPGGL